MRRAVPSLALLVALVGAGCASETTGGAVIPSLTLGTGSWRFEPVMDGEEIGLIRGAQGGWHIWLSFRVQGVTSSTADLEVRTTVDSAPEHKVDTRVTVTLDPPTKDGARLLIGWPNILENPGCFVGQTVTVHATMDDDDGVPMEDERTIVIGPGDDPPSACNGE